MQNQPPVTSPTPPLAQSRPRVAATNSKAIASFAIGLAALFIPVPFVLGIIAIFLGNSARREMGDNRNEQGEGFAIAGIVLGWVDIVLSLVLGLLMLFFFAFIFAA